MLAINVGDFDDVIVQAANERVAGLERQAQIEELEGVAHRPAAVEPGRGQNRREAGRPAVDLAIKLDRLAAEFLLVRRADQGEATEGQRGRRIAGGRYVLKDHQRERRETVGLSAALEFLERGDEGRQRERPAFQQFETAGLELFVRTRAGQFQQLGMRHHSLSLARKSAFPLEHT